MLKRFLEVWRMPGGYKALLLVAYPLLMQSAASIVMLFCDRKFLANSSTEELAAALPAGHLVITLGVFFITFLDYSGPLTAQFFGAKRNDKCIDVLWTSAATSLLAAGVMIFILPLVGWGILALSVEGKTFEYGFRYFLAMLPGEIALSIAAPFFAFYAGRGKTLVVSLVNIAGTALNVLLDWLLIFGNCGFPKLGIAGAGIATSISLILGMTAIVLIVLIAPDQREFPTREWKRFDRDIFHKLFFIGGPSGIQRLSNSLKFTVIILLVGVLGDMALASTGIAMSIINLSFMPLVALAGSNMILSGQALGREDQNSASQITFRAWKCAMLYTFLALLFYAAFAKPVIALFAPEQSTEQMPFELVSQHAYRVLLIMGFWLICDTGRYIFGSLLRASGDTKALLKINLLVAWLIGIPGFALLALVVKPPVYYVWSFFIVISLTESLWIYVRFRQGVWRTLRLTRGREME